MRSLRSGHALLLAAAVAGLPAAAAEVNVSNASGAQSETDIVVDPTNPSHLLGGSNNISQTSPAQNVYESTNGGQTWATTALAIPSGFAFESDPAVTFDHSGNAYYAFIAVDSSASNTSLWVTKKAQGSSSWGTAVQVTATQPDKQFITADLNPASPCAGSIYLAWDDNASGGQIIRLSRSTNAGATFGQGTQVNTSGTGNIGAYPLVLPNGHLVVAWNQYQPGTQLTIATSTDCGQTFGPEHVIHTWSLTTAGSLQYMPPSDPQRGITPFPWLAVDSSGGAHKGRIYCTSNDMSSNNSGVDALLWYSDDEGSTWSTGAVLNDDATGQSNDQYFPRVAVDPQDGSVHVPFYDTRNDPTHKKTDVYIATSAAGGTAWSANQRLTTQMSDESGSGADPNGYGDYIGNCAAPGVAHPLWTEDPSGTNEDVYTVAVAPPSDFSLTASPTQVQLGQSGATATVTLSTAVVAGSPPSIALSVSGLPSGVTGSFQSTSVTPGQSTTLTLSSNGAQTGSYTATITGDSGATSHQVQETVVVVAGPAISFVTPQDGSTVSGSVNVQVQAANASASASISITLDGQALASGQGTSLTHAWDTTQASNGSHLLVATVTDGGKSGTAQVSVTVNNPLTVAITAPADGATLSGKAAAITATAKLNGGTLATIEIDMDDFPVGTGSTTPFTATVDATQLGTGSHSVSAKATDSNGNVAVSPVIHVTVNNAPPTPDGGTGTRGGGTDGGSGPGTTGSGCGCGAGPSGFAAGWLLGILALLATRRRARAGG